jgi:N-acyl homoserine lactone hydrolase
MTNFGGKTKMCIYSWYIEGSSPRILVDPGCQADLLIAHLGNPTEHIQLLEEGLGKFGVKPDDIDIVILTHLHGDHVALAHKFPRAKFILQKAELEALLHPHPFTASAGFYNLDNIKGLNIQTIEGDKEIADGIKVIATPGHTQGNQSVVVNTPLDTATITGFCCMLDNFNLSPKAKARGLEVIPPGRTCNMLDAYDSAVRVKKMGGFIIPCHEASFASQEKLPL